MRLLFGSSLRSVCLTPPRPRIEKETPRKLLRTPPRFSEVGEILLFASFLVLIVQFEEVWQDPNSRTTGVAPAID
jgi:hypothetical protein